MCRCISSKCTLQTQKSQSALFPCSSVSDSVQFCGSTEAVIRLVISAVVGVATVAVVVYDITSGRAQ